MQQRAGVNAEDNVHAPQTAWQQDWRKVGWAALLFSVLQAACPAIIALSGLRVLIGWAGWLRPQVRRRRREGSTRTGSGSR